MEVNSSLQSKIQYSSDDLKDNVLEWINRKEDLSTEVLIHLPSSILVRYIFCSKINNSSPTDYIVRQARSIYIGRAQEMGWKNTEGEINYSDLDQVRRCIASITRHFKEIIVKKIGNEDVLKESTSVQFVQSVEFIWKLAVKLGYTGSDFQQAIEYMEKTAQTSNSYKPILDGIFTSHRIGRFIGILRHIAIPNNLIDIIKILFDLRVGMNAKNDSRSTLIDYTAGYGPYFIAQLLRDNGAKVNAKDDSEWKPLHKAVWFPKKEDFIQLLLANRADPHAKDKNGDTP